MKDLWKRIWYSEPVLFVGALSAAWLALVAVDQANESWKLPLWTYIAAAPVVAFLTYITRETVTAPANLPEVDDGEAP